MSMARNVEIKARVEDLAALKLRAAALADAGPFHLQQTDVFFRCKHGRLKLRTHTCGSGELIVYRRADAPGPRPCEYLRVRSADPRRLRRLLQSACGELGTVCKERCVYLRGRTRMHLDQVTRLGAYLELEAVLADDEEPDAATAEVSALMAQLGVRPHQLVPQAYIDLLVADAQPPAPPQTR
jgi:predicted adenylyl cyclase CyaB